MKKLMMLAAMLAMMLAMAAPAFAQINIDATEGDDIEFNAVAQNISGGFGDIDQSQFGDATATASAGADADGDESVAVADSSATAEVSQSQHFTFEQFNSALNDF